MKGYIRNIIKSARNTTTVPLDTGNEEEYTSKYDLEVNSTNQELRDLKASGDDTLAQLMPEWQEIIEKETEYQENKKPLIPNMFHIKGTTTLIQKQIPTSMNQTI